MSCCGGAKNSDDKKSKDIDKALKDRKKELDQEVKLLLLGAGESGKSTIAKQMKILHLQGFSKEEMMTYRSIIYNNIVTSMRALINAAKDLGINLSSASMEAAARLGSDDLSMINESLSAQTVADVKQLWGDAGVKSAYQRQNEFQLNDSAAYYFDAIDRLADNSFIPTEQDVLRSRAKTTGIIEIEFTIQKTKFKMVDVGGQRSERKKWLHCFQDVTSVIYCSALSEFDLKLYEDDSTNRMMESLQLFGEVCNNKWFVNTAMILFLNKKDLFAEKIKKVDLNVCFPQYQGGKDFDKATSYIKERFLAENKNPRKHIYVHVTCATDTDNINVVFNAVKDIILQGIINDSGLSGGF